MTSQLKHFVDLSDIATIRFECGKCHASISLPISEKLKTQGVRVCPSCNESWTQLAEGANLEAVCQDFAKSLHALRSVLKEAKKYTEHKMVVSLELIPETFPASRASSGKD
jgi:ribosomal protein S27AE